MTPAAWNLEACKLFVGGLASQTTTEELRGHFSKYGRLVDAVVMSKQGRPRGFGFVTFASPASAAAALSEAQWLGDRFVDVKRAVPGEQPEERAPNKIFVGGLPQDASIEDLRACFAEYGPIADAVVMVDRRTRRSRGFGFIRFASSAQGSRAAEQVLQDAANHRLGGKWVEVKRATPAALLQDASPGSGSPSTPCALHHQSPQQRLKQLDLQQRSSWGEACMGPWSSLDAMTNVMGWPAGELSPAFSPMHYTAEMHGFDTTPLSVSTAFDSAALRFEEEEDSSDVDRRLFSPDQSDEEENRPAAANRSITPPPGIKRPPGLGIEASPMKIECRSGLFENLAIQQRCKSVPFKKDFMKIQPLLSAC